MLKVADLTEEQLAKFSWWRCDKMLEKHESWGSWQDDLAYTEFITVLDQPVLLPYLPDDLTRLKINEAQLSQDETVMTIFLTELGDGATEAEIDWTSDGYLAVCYRVSGEMFYVAVVYHARYIVPGPIAGAPKTGWQRLPH